MQFSGEIVQAIVLQWPQIKTLNHCQPIGIWSLLLHECHRATTIINGNGIDNGGTIIFLKNKL